MSKYFYINGEFRDPVEQGELFDVINPRTEEVIFKLPFGSAKDVDLAVNAAEQAFKTFGSTTREERLKLLEKVVEVYIKRTKDLGKAVADEMGAELNFACETQVGIGLTHLKTFVEELKNYSFEEKVGKALLYKVPIGVVAMVTPWNWPMNQITLKVGAALAAGCTMVLKPSEYTPTSGRVFAEVLHEAGVPPGVFNLVHGFGPVVGAALSAHPKVQMVSFTGSTRAGIDVAIKAAPTVKRVAQELGGKSGNILLDDAGFAEAVTRGAMHCFHNCGQSCNAPTRMLVPVHRLSEARQLASLSASRAEPSLQPLVNRLQFERVRALIAKGIQEGCELAAGGLEKIAGREKGFFVKPTVFVNVKNTDTIAREEIFGPVLSILGYESVEEAIEIANDTPYGLAGYVQGLDVQACLKVARKLRVGNVSINGTSFEPKAPFGGFKQSGNSREMGKFGIDELLELQAVVGAQDN